MISMPPIMRLGSPTHPDDKGDGPLTFVDPLGDVSGECQVVGEGQGVGTDDGVLLDCAQNCVKETRHCGKVLWACKQQLKFFLVCKSCV
jgi:hypothetical protein